MKKLIHRRLAGALSGSCLLEGGLLTISLIVPETRLGSLPPLQGDWIFWGEPIKEEYMLGTGEALLISAQGKRRLSRLNQGFRSARSNWQQQCLDGHASPAVAFTGFAFSDNDPMIDAWHGIPNAALFVPELLVHQLGNRCEMHFTCSRHPAATRETILDRWMSLFQHTLAGMREQPGPSGRRTPLERCDEKPSADDWQQLVRRAIADIRPHGLKKTVPARVIRVRARRRLQPHRLMATLDCLFPSSMLFCLSRNGRVFSSATPERLAAVQHESIVCDAIGGTIERGIDEAGDRELENTLRRDPKAICEHALIVEDIELSLGGLGIQTDPHDEPGILKLRNLQHLRTPIRGRLSSGVSLLDAAEALHPTAAVNGFPTEQASAWLRQHEPLRRGWYSGAAGWIDTNGNGKLAVLLRCALLENQYAELFAGAGVTADSDPALELQETELKFGTMLEALENA
ncbi:MAG: isochorismate synthase [Gammaproteobacteria bacterium]|nr:isochorismate synthase [Gammaproteobacteria bacterium]